MKKVNIYISVLFILIKSASAQYVGSTTQGRSGAGNLIFNNGFEAADAQGYPNAVAQSDHMHSWESRTYYHEAYNRWLHSPDWIYTGLGGQLQTSWTPIPAPLNGHGIVGMGNYELLQQNFRNEDMKEGELYIVSMYIYLFATPPSYAPQNSTLKCYLAKQGVKYISENNYVNNCTPQYIDHRTFANSPIYSNVTKEIGSWNINLNNYPSTGGWTKISQVFRAPSNTFDWDYFVIEMRQNNYDPNGIGNHCEDGYIFIDDVSLEEVDQCGKACSPILPAIEYSTIPDAIIAGNAPGFTMLIKNSMGINFEIFDTDGHEMYNQYAFDPNGLIDDGYSDYYFSWTGRKPDGSFYPQDVYAYKLRLWNCQYDQTFYNSLTYVPGNGSAQQSYDIQNSNLNNCCVDHLSISSKQYYPGISFERADQWICAGTMCAPSSPGPVICKNGSDVKYVSASIILAPGFSVQPGASFTAITTNTCADEYVRSNSHIRDRTVFSYKNNLTESNILYTISPNPSCEGIFKFTSNIEYNQIENVEIYNAVGKRIQNNKEIFDAFTINLNDYSKGMYFVKVKLINNPTIFVSKLIYI